jgi:hypothetical protein
MMMEVVDVGRDAVMQVDNQIEDGWIVLGDSPGLGMTIDDKKLERFLVEKTSPEASSSPWRRRQGAGLYEVPPDEPEEIGEE